MKKDFEFLSHTADIQMRAYGKTKEELFCNALNGMFQSIGPHAQGCETKNGRLICPQLPEKQTVDIRSTQFDLLLVDFLSEALYFSDIHNQAYFDAEIHELTDTHVRATLRGVQIERFDVVEIKAVTYHELEVKQVDGVWQATIVFDI